MTATTTPTLQWLKTHRHENNRFLATLGTGIITIAALFALTELANLSVILAWSAITLLALALPWTDWVRVWNRDTEPRAWDRRDAAGNYRPPRAL